jgi:hypothetical protein
LPAAPSGAAAGIEAPATGAPKRAKSYLKRLEHPENSSIRKEIQVLDGAAPVAGPAGQGEQAADGGDGPPGRPAEPLFATELVGVHAEWMRLGKAACRLMLGFAERIVAGGGRPALLQELQRFSRGGAAGAPLVAHHAYNPVFDMPGRGTFFEGRDGDFERFDAGFEGCGADAADGSPADGSPAEGPPTDALSRVGAKRPALSRGGSSPRGKRAKAAAGDGLRDGAGSGGGPAAGSSPEDGVAPNPNPKPAVGQPPPPGPKRRLKRGEPVPWEAHQEALARLKKRHKREVAALQKEIDATHRAATSEQQRLQARVAELKKKCADARAAGAREVAALKRKRYDADLELKSQIDMELESRTQEAADARREMNKEKEKRRALEATLSRLKRQILRGGVQASAGAGGASAQVGGGPGLPPPPPPAPGRRALVARDDLDIVRPREIRVGAAAGRVRRRARIIALNGREGGGREGSGRRGAPASVLSVSNSRDGFLAHAFGGASSRDGFGLAAGGAGAGRRAGAAPGDGAAGTAEGGLFHRVMQGSVAAARAGAGGNAAECMPG